MEIVGDIVDEIDNDLRSAAVLCDLTKAFDCKSHKILCQKLEFYGIRRGPLRLI